MDKIMAPTGLPKTASWIITTQCNMRCLHCYVPSGHQKNELNSTQVKIAIDRLADFGIKMLIVSGGEPLLKKDIFDMCEHATSRGLYLSICTNGSTLSADTVNRLKRYNLFNISISLDGSTPETNDKLRNFQGAFEMACNGIRLCLENNLRVSIDTTITRLNYRSVQRIIPLCSGLGVDLIMFRRFMPLGRGKDNLNELFISPAEHISSLNNCIRESLHYPKISIAFHDPTFRAFLMKNICNPLYFRYMISKLARNILFGKTPDQEEGYNIKRISRAPSRNTGCLASTGWFGIMPDGGVRPCPLLPVKIGNILQPDLADIWRDSNIIRELKYRGRLKEKCGRCLSKGDCSGCRAYAFSMKSDYLEADTFCLV